MSQVIFDIETIGLDFESLDQQQQDYMLKFAESEQEIEEAKQKLALYPLTGEVVAIGMLNVETNKGVVYYRDEQNPEQENSEADVLYKAGTEEQVITNFWQAFKNYDQFITFNGRGFDCPFLHLRSGILQIEPTKNLMPYRYSTDIHIDLLDQLTFQGAYRKFSLDFYCKAFGIKSPKQDGITGLDVPDLFKQGKTMDIARYCYGDLVATKELYQRWQKFINIK